MKEANGGSVAIFPCVIPPTYRCSLTMTLKWARGPVYVHGGGIRAIIWTRCVSCHSEVLWSPGAMAFRSPDNLVLVMKIDSSWCDVFMLAIWTQSLPDVFKISVPHVSNRFGSFWLIFQDPHNNCVLWQWKDRLNQKEEWMDSFSRKISLNKFPKTPVSDLWQKWDFCEKDMTCTTVTSTLIFFDLVTPQTTKQWQHDCEMAWGDRQCFCFTWGLLMHSNCLISCHNYNTSFLLRHLFLYHTNTVHSLFECEVSKLVRTSTCSIPPNRCDKPRFAPQSLSCP